MRVRVVGCSGSFSGPRSASSCYLVEHEAQGRTWRLVLDLGSGALGELQRYTDPTAVDAYLISHLHPDHLVDLCGLYVLHTYDPHASHPDRIAVHGPAALREHMDGVYGVHPGESLWDLAVADWVPSRDPATLAAAILRDARPGSILVLHDGPPAARAVEALALALPRLSAAGWRFPALPAR